MNVLLAEINELRGWGKIALCMGAVIFIGLFAAWRNKR